MDFEGAATAGVDALSFFPNEKGDVEPNVPNAGLPNEDKIFGLDVAFPNGPAGAGPDPVAGEPAGVVENRFVGVPKADGVLGVARPPVLLLVAEIPISDCLPKVPVEAEFTNVEPPKADAVASNGDSDGLAAASFAPKVDVASFLVSPVTVVKGDEVRFEGVAVVGAPNVNLGLVSTGAGAPVDGCPNENLVKAGPGCVAELVVVAEGVAEKENIGAGGFGSDDAVADEVVPSVDVVAIGVVVGVVTGTAGEEALVNEGPAAVGFANEKVEALGASAVVCVGPPEDGWVWLATGNVKGAAAGVADGAGDVEGFPKKFGMEAEDEGAAVVVVVVAGKENAGAAGAVVAGWGALVRVKGAEEVEGRVNPGAAQDVGKLVADFGSVVATGTGVKENDDGALASVDVTLLSTFASTGEGDAGVSVIVGTVKVFEPN